MWPYMPMPCTCRTWSNWAGPDFLLLLNDSQKSNSKITISIFWIANWFRHVWCLMRKSVAALQNNIFSRRPFGWIRLFGWISVNRIRLAPVQLFGQVSWSRWSSPRVSFQIHPPTSIRLYFCKSFITFHIFISVAAELNLTWPLRLTSKTQSWII